MSVASAYAKALFEVLEIGVSFSEQTLDEVQSQLEELARLFEFSKSLRLMILSPITSQDEKDKVLGLIVQRLGASPELQSFLQLLSRNHRLNLFKKIILEFQVLRTETKKGLIVFLEAASYPSVAEVRSFTKKLQEKFQKPIVLTIEVHPELIAGIRLIIEGKTYDASIRSQLQAMMHVFLLKGAAAVESRFS